MPELLKLSNVKLAFGGEVRLRIEDLSIPRGEKVLILGHNGAGKTSLLNVAAGIAHTTGTVTCSDSVHLFGHQSMLFSSLTISEHLELWKAVFQAKSEVFSALTTEWEIDKFLCRTPNQLSRGEQARVALVRTFASNSELLLFDEPTNALDKTFVKRLERAITSSKKTLIVSSHAITPTIFERIIVLKNGTIVKDTSDTKCFAAVVADNLGE